MPMILSAWICVSRKELFMLKPTFLSVCASWALFLGLIGSAVHEGRAAGAYTENPGTEGDGDFTIGPDYKIDPDLTDKGNPNPKGKSFELSMPLADSKIFRGDDKTLEPEKKAVRKARKLFDSEPAAFQDGAKAPVLVMHDGPSHLDQVRNALGNLTISKDPNRSLPAFIVIAVENGGNDGKKSERGLEYDTLSDRYARFINDEVFPAVLQSPEIKAAYPHLAITDNPWGRATPWVAAPGARRR